VLVLLPVVFFSLSHPFSLRLIVTLQTLFTSLYIYSHKRIIWIALILTLIIVGGLMISFVYVSSLIPSEPYTRQFVRFLPVVLVPFIFLILKPMIKMFERGVLEYSPVNLINSNTYLGTLVIVGVLLITLLVVCINTLQVKTPMRSYS
jgi:NADH-ubiquinone oxidoreductase chain 6